MRREDLIATFEQVGLADVETFRASGNVTFAAPATADEQLDARIEGALADRFGFPVLVYVRSAAELEELIAAEGFRGIRRRTAGKLQVALLRDDPPPDVRERVLAHGSEDDLLRFARRALLWLPRAGTQRSSLKLRAIEKLIGPWTMRTMETIEQVVARYFESA